MNAKWIWINENAEKDIYVRFQKKFNSSSGKLKLNISCDSVFCAYINGKLVAFSACADYPDYKLFDEFLVEVEQGENLLEILVWYYGENSQTYITDKPGVWFTVSENNKMIACSDTDTLACFEENFKQNYKKIITYQLGYSFFYDNTLKNKPEYRNCVETGKRIEPIKRPQKNLKLGNRIPVEYHQKEKSLLVDFGKEYAGYVDFDFVSPCKQTLTVAFGEHLKSGHVSRFIGNRDFSFEIKAREGKNVFFIPLRRVAGRYLEVYTKQKITPVYLGLRPVYYPVTEIGTTFDERLLQDIYDTSVRTLRLCIHEHYEDCPWREQALYTMDSRNQMLFGYYAFVEKEYPRSNILLIAKGLRPDGLLSLCFPAGIDIPIPSFSLVYILQVCEYVAHSGDKTLLNEVESVLKTILNTFANRIDETGLIPVFPYPYWNFYEWSEGNHREWEIMRSPDEPYKKDYDLTLNCLFIFAVETLMNYVDCNIDTKGIKNAIIERFYNKEKGVFKNSFSDESFSQLGNSLACLVGLGDSSLVEKIATSNMMTKATLSMKTFVYDALLLVGYGYKRFILEDIKSTYKYMLDAGATSFWETEKGWQDFNGAGSLCHGWSALPIYYFNVLGVIKHNEKGEK